MKVKKFFASTMQEALKLVREELGSDAVILSSRKVDGGIEIVSALNYDEQRMMEECQDSGMTMTPGQIGRMHADKHLALEKEKVSSRERIIEATVSREGARRAPESHEPLSAPPRVEAERIRRSEVSRKPVSPRVAPGTPTPVKVQKMAWQAEAQPEAVVMAASDNSAIREMQAQILQLQELLKQQIQSTEKKTSVVYNELNKRLVAMGIESSLREELLEGSTKERDLSVAWRRILGTLASQLPVEQEEIIDQAGCVAFLGTTGAGKTTTIGKLAARFVLKYGAQSLALVTTDRYRIAAHEQLRVFGRILGVSVSVVDDENSLNEVLDRLKGKKLVLIDTAGLNQNCKDWQTQVEEFIQCKYEIKHYLVLPATSQQQILKSSFHAYSGVGLTGCIVTKIDEAVSLGEVIGFLCRVELPVGYLTDGQHIPDDIHPAKASLLISRSVELLSPPRFGSQEGLSNQQTGS